MLQISGIRSSGNSITICFLKVFSLLPSPYFGEALLTDIILSSRFLILLGLPHTAFYAAKIVRHNIVHTHGRLSP